MLFFPLQVATALKLVQITPSSVPEMEANVTVKQM